MFVYGSLSKSQINECKELGMSPSDIEKYAAYHSKKVSQQNLGGRNGTRDSDKSKVYQSEWAMQKQIKIRQFKDINEADKRMSQIISSKLWKDLDGKACYLINNKRMGRATAGRAWHGGKIELSPSTGMDEYTLIHEMTHQLPKCMHHSVQFRINLIKLVSRFMGREAAAILKAEFKERKLKLSMPKPRTPASWYKSYKHMQEVREQL